MDIGWGGVPRMVPSDIALKYLNDNVKVQAESDLPAGGHLRSRRILEEELRGHKQGKLDLLESYNQFYLEKKRLRRDAKPMTCSGVRPSKLSAGNEYKAPMDPIYYHQKQCAFGPVNTRCPMFRSTKPGAGLGWTEPRMEAFLGLVDRRLRLPGYVGGVKKRDSKFAGK
eukprot:TRINITY_DN359_c0_g1_i4.p1 TRINITY_DN359_c0_g1~~TRINITY_DN359_c0_g1_i4.p1  ORF type:complete len:169 (-),score=46.85 TRINITY_DN359_c0_g1_i4:65-571(-)